MQETDAQLSFNYIFGAGGEGSLSLDTKLMEESGSWPHQASGHRFLELGSILYRITLTNEKVGDDMKLPLAKHDLATRLCQRARPEPDFQL